MYLASYRFFNPFQLIQLQSMAFYHCTPLTYSIPYNWIRETIQLQIFTTQLYYITLYIQIKLPKGIGI